MCLIAAAADTCTAYQCKRLRGRLRRMAVHQRHNSALTAPGAAHHDQCIQYTILRIFCCSTRLAQRPQWCISRTSVIVGAPCQEHLPRQPQADSGACGFGSRRRSCCAGYQQTTRQAERCRLATHAVCCTGGLRSVGMKAVGFFAWTHDLDEAPCCGCCVAAEV
jgi:hypothetical protein